MHFAGAQTQRFGTQNQQFYLCSYSQEANVMICVVFHLNHIPAFYYACSQTVGFED